VRNFLIGLFLGFTVISCASVQYTVYVLRFREGKLNARVAKDDLPISVCDDTAQSKANCYVILRSEYQKLLRDMAEKDRLLSACQRGQ
jgi:hypothetical protein